MQIHNYIKTSLIDYPKKISCVVFTQGCMWRCWYCQNAELLATKQGLVPEDEILNFLKSHKSFLDGVVICGGEPTLQPDLKDFLKKIKGLGFLIKLDTNGTNPDVLKDLIDQNLIDYVAMDLKAPLDKYKQIASVDVDTKKIKQSIDILLGGQVDYEFRTTVVPTLTQEDLMDMAKTIKGAKRYFLQHYIKQSSYNKPQLLYDDNTLNTFVLMCDQFVPTKLR